MRWLLLLIVIDAAAFYWWWSNQAERRYNGIIRDAAAEFDVEYGTPLSPARRTSPHSWVRNYTRSNAAIDVSGGKMGRVDLL